MKRVVLAWLGIACGAVALTGCIEIAEPLASPSTDAEIIDFIRSEAIADGKASDRQLEILQDAISAGTVTRADVELASADFLTCLDDAGLKYHYNEEEAVAGSGVWIPAPLIISSDEDPDGEADILGECQFRHAIYVASAYAAQAWVAQAEALVWSSEATRMCLAARGYPVEDNTTADEIKIFNQQDLESHFDDAAFTPCVTNAMTWSPGD